MNKIAISGYVGPIKTGIGKTLENIIVELKSIDNGNTYLLFYNKDNSDYLKYIDGKKIIGKVFNISKNSPILNILWHQFILPIRLLKYSVDILYVPNVTLLTIKICKTVVVLHDMIEFNVAKKFNRIRMIYRKFAVPLTAKTADHIITVSQHSKKDIIKFCKVPSNKITVIHNGVDKSYKPMELSNVKDILKKHSIVSPYILYVGTIDHPGKNAISLIKAFNIFKKNNPNYQLVLVGKPGYGYKTIEKEIINLEIAESIVIPGYVPDEDLPAIYSGAKVFVLLSLYEGFGLPLVEAMACGTPIIASNRSCFPEIVGDYNRLVDPYDIDAVANKISELVNNEKYYSEVVEAGKNRAKLFNWSNSAKNTLKAFNRYL